MKILLPTIDYPPMKGGIARYLQNLARQFPDVIDIDFQKELKGRWKFFFHVFLKSKNYDQIWTSHILPIGTYLFLNKIFAQKPYAVFLHGLDFDLARRNRWKKSLTWLILRNAKYIFTNSHALKKEVVNFTHQNRIKVIYPTLPFELEQKAREYKKKIKEKNSIVLLTVARLVKRKGHKRIMSLIVDMPNIVYRIVGSGSELVPLKELAENLGISDRVSFFPDISDEELIEYYKDSDIFVMPTISTKNDREGFGIVYLEAGAFGLPVIASDLKGVDEAVINGKTGFLVSNDQELAKMIDILQTDANLRKKMGEEGKKRALKEFSSNSQNTKLSAIFYAK